MNRKKRSNKEKEIFAVSIFSTLLIFITGVFLYFADCFGTDIERVITNLAVPFVLTFVFVIVEVVREKYKDKEDETD